MNSIRLIWNPVAGSGRAMSTFSAVTELMKEQGIEYSEAMTSCPGHATELAKQAAEDGIDLVLALGGDGTVREVAAGLFGSNTTLALIPSGSGNDLARALKIPADPAGALEAALHGQRRRMDAGRANGELFFNVFGFGFDVDVLKATEKYKSKCKKGTTAYRLGLFSVLLRLTHRKTSIDYIDEQGNPQHLDSSVLLLAAGIGNYYGSGIPSLPEADLFDGLLDVCVLHDVSYLALPFVLPRFLQGKHIGLKQCTYFRARSLTAAAEPVSEIQLDGEIMPATPVTVTILPESILIACPKA